MPIMCLLVSGMALLLPLIACSMGSRSERAFALRHIHTLDSKSGRILWADVNRVHAPPLGESLESVSNDYVLRTRMLRIHKPTISSDVYDVDNNSRNRQENSSTSTPGHRKTGCPRWEERNVEAPEVDKRETLLTLAKMTNNAYLLSNNSGWYDLSGNWTVDGRIGWDPETDGLRGYVFLSADNTTAVLSIKGTSAGLFGGGKTIKKDKLNNNLLFSCCCARVDWTWSPVCDCHDGGNVCNQNCLEHSLADDNLFYHVGVNLYKNLTSMYPDAKIWIVGHSLGGSLASLIGLTFGVPVVAFAAIPERLPAQRMRIPMPPSTLHIVHVYNTADPIAMGVCNGLSSVCYYGGFALETKCHIGQTIVYDTVNQLQWSVNIKAHFILTIIDRLLDEDWSEKLRKTRTRSLGFGLREDKDNIEVPKPTLERYCVECHKWKFVDHMID